MESKDQIEFPYDIVFDTPHRLTDIKSWHGHIPFAFFIVQAMRPKIFVELGVHKGDSYCAFCQAAKKLGVNCKCYGIDTWKGDHQSGFYGEEVLEELKQFHDVRFSGFSLLIRSSFDNALPRFPNKSIDLLHIDGCHDYQAVYHDFMSWLPKMSQRGIILFHDTSEKGSDFGVWKLWQEVSHRYPSFEFHHSHGLGVLLVGQEMPENLKPMFLGSERDRHLIREFFAAMGDRISYKRLATELEEQVTYLVEMTERHRKMIEERDRRIKGLQERMERTNSSSRERVK